MKNKVYKNEDYLDQNILGVNMKGLENDNNLLKTNKEEIR